MFNNCLIDFLCVTIKIVSIIQWDFDELSNEAIFGSSARVKYGSDSVTKKVDTHIISQKRKSMEMRSTVSNKKISIRFGPVFHF